MRPWQAGAARVGQAAATQATLGRTLRLLKPRYEQAPELWQSSLLPLCVRYVQLSESAGAAIDLSLVEDVIVRAQQEAVVRG